jgi:hypothetical protein
MLAPKAPPEDNTALSIGSKDNKAIALITALRQNISCHCDAITRGSSIENVESLNRALSTIVQYLEA